MDALKLRAMLGNLLIGMIGAILEVVVLHSTVDESCLAQDRHHDLASALRKVDYVRESNTESRSTVNGSNNTIHGV